MSKKKQCAEDDEVSTFPSKKRGKHVYAMVFSAGLNSLQVNQVDKAKEKMNLYLHTIS